MSVFIFALCEVWDTKQYSLGKTDHPPATEKQKQPRIPKTFPPSLVFLEQYCIFYFIIMAMLLQQINDCQICKYQKCNGFKIIHTELNIKELFEPTALLMMTQVLDLLFISFSEMLTAVSWLFPSLPCKNAVFQMHNLLPVLSKQGLTFLMDLIFLISSP